MREQTTEWTCETCNQGIGSTIGDAVQHLEHVHHIPHGTKGRGISIAHLDGRESVSTVYTWQFPGCILRQRVTAQRTSAKRSKR